MKQIIKTLAISIIVFYTMFAFLSWDLNWMNDGVIIRIIYFILVIVFSSVFTPQNDCHE